MEKINPRAFLFFAMSTTYLDPAAQMRIKSLELRVKDYLSAFLSRSQCAAGLVVDAAGGRFVWPNSGFASRYDAVYPGSPRLGSADPGLNSATPLGLVYGGAKWWKMSLAGQGGFARSARFISCGPDWRECGEQLEERGRSTGAGIATRCECVWGRDVRRRGVSLRSTPRYRLGWLRHPEMKMGFDNDRRSKGCQWTGLVTHQRQEEPPSGN
jgi:hypothetical protein